MTAPCRSCGAPILWVRTLAGKATPLDAAPSAPQVDGVWIRYPDPGRVGAFRGRRYVALIDGTTYVDLHLPHWATCPNVEQHRKR